MGYTYYVETYVKDFDLRVKKDYINQKYNAVLI